MRVTALSMATLVSLLAGFSAFAADTLPEVPDLPPLKASALESGDPIRLTPDGPAVIKLGADAASVIVGNPAHATAVLENPRLIMVMPQQPGATKIMVLDRDGKAILNRHILVSDTRAGFLRIKRICSAAQAKAACQPYTMYYCPDKCYVSAVPSEAAQQDAQTAPAPASADVPPPAPADAGIDDQPSTDVMQ